MSNIIQDEFKRLKGDRAAIAAIVFLGVSIFAMAPFAGITSIYMLDENYFMFLGATIGKLLLYAMPALALLIYLEDFYKTKRHTNWFLILGGIATAAQLAVIALNWGEFALGFHSDTIHLLFTVSLVLLVVQPLVTLICFLTQLNVTFPRIACLLTVIALTMYLIMALMAGYWMLALLSGSYIFYSIGLAVAIPKIVGFEREHGHYIHHT